MGVEGRAVTITGKDVLSDGAVDATLQSLLQPLRGCALGIFLVNNDHTVVGM